MDAKRESACPASGSGQAWLQQAWLLKRDRVYRLYLMIPAECPTISPEIGSLTLQQARG